MVLLKVQNPFTKRSQLLVFATLTTLSLMTSGCLVSYLVNSGYEQMKLLSDRKPIEEVLKDKNLAPEHRHKLELALNVRDYAEQKLNLKLTNNYNTFVDLKRPYVTYIVTVAKKWQLESELYWYPIVGHLPYKGFFTKKEADKEASQFDKNKFDVMVRGVSAYSTLGWFDDPLLSSMITGEDHDLVNMILHESTHATLFFKSQADFNERLATYVGNLGTQMYYSQIEGQDSPTLKKMQADSEDEKLFSTFISEEIELLKKWYEGQSSNISKTQAATLNTNHVDGPGPAHPREMLREARFKEIQDRFTKNLEPRLQTNNYKNFTKMKLNNAVLLYFKTYVFDLHEFENVYVKLDKNFEAFLKFCKNLEKENDPQAKLKSYASEPQK